MILVTGTKRSGTSMWMQILVAAGFPYIGEAFPGPWQETIGAANPRGFYESPLRKGIFWATNPDPDTGLFLFPKATRRHLVKVFIPGLVCTDYAFLDRVVATMRPWRDYCASLERLYALEDASIADRERAPARRSPLPPAVEWWFENYELIRDFATRRYPINLVSYDRLLEDPERVIRGVVGWLGGGEIEAAVAAVEPSLRSTSGAPAPAVDLSESTIALFDALHDAVYREQGLPASLLARLNEEQERMRERWLPDEEPGG